MSKEKKKTMTPKVRFPEFREEGEWEEKTLGDKEIALFVKEKMPFEKLTLESYISTENLLPDYAGTTTASKLPPSGSFTKFKSGDILISNIRPYLKKVWVADKVGAASNDVIVIRGGAAVSETFLSFLLKNDSFINYVMEGAKGLKMPRGDKSLMEEYRIVFPNKPEQQKIASTLTSLDDLITAQSEKIKALQAHKKGLMQQLFPAEGERAPRLRFGEFEGAGDWEESQLGEMTTKVGSGITPKGGDKTYKTEGRPFVRSQNVGWGNLILGDIAFIDEATHSNFSSTEIYPGDVLLNITGASIGRSAIADTRIKGGNVNQHVCIIRTKKELSPIFLNQYLLSNYGQKQIDSFQAGGNRQGLNFAQILSMTIPVPSTFEEQQKIASTLTSLDDLIATQHEKLEALKMQNKGLMQQLFPNPNDEAI